MKLLERTVLALAAAGALAHFLVWSVRFATWPWVLNKGEGICLWSAVQLLRGHLPYPDPSLPPFSLCAYPIGYPALAAVFVAVFGKGLFGLRVLSVIGEAAAAFAGASLLARRTGRPHAHAWGALLLGLLSVHKFHAMARVDLPALALVVTAVGLLVRFADSRRAGTLTALAAAALGAMLVKPTAVVTLTAGAAWTAFAVRGSRRDLARLTAALLTAAAAWAAVTFALQSATGGEYLRQTVELHALKGTWPSGWIWQGFRDQYLPLLAAGAIALLLPADPLLKLLAGTAAAWAVFSTRTAGSDLNYTLETLTWTTLLVASASANLLRRAAAAGGRWRPAALRAACLAAVVAAVLPLRHGPFRAGELTPEIREEGETLNRLMVEANGVTLSEEPFFAVIHDKDLLVDDAFGLSVLAASGRVDPKALVMELDEGRVARVFLGTRLRADSAIVGALRRNYRQIYVTRNRLADTRWIVLDPVTVRGPATPGSAPAASAPGAAKAAP